MSDKVHQIAQPPTANEAARAVLVADRALVQFGRTEPDCHECLIVNYLRAIAVSLAAIANTLESRPS